ncbi:MAG TPA: glycine/sarcosine/betaine reductase component B subunit [Solirubrobacteraceae bacterium]|nr:glycine/sarcosine/betaine reductase component B subunit [Solirubrobacteraceae bacterium]
MSATRVRDDERQSGTGLRLLSHDVVALAVGETTSYDEGLLTVGEREARELLAHPVLAGARVHCASPGDSTRIIKILDAVEPRCKGEGAPGAPRAEVFPGLVGPPQLGGRGETHVLRGAAVLSAGFLPRAQESVLQMSGAGAELSPLAALHNVVVEFEPAEDAAWEEVASALRLGVLRLAVHLAQAARAVAPDEVDELEPSPATSGELPRVVAVTNIQTQGAFKDVLVYGRSMAGALPTWIDPCELADGAVVSAQYGHPALKNPTYVHQNNPVVAALRASDEVELAGVVLCPEPVAEREKRLVSEHAARLCAALGVDGAIVTKEGGGNADGDVALKLDALEDLGIPAVGLFAEMAGRDGTAPGLVVAPTQATALISTGNYDELIQLEAVDRALGGERLGIVNAAASDELELPVAAIYGSLNPLGFSRVTCAGEA